MKLKFYQNALKWTAVTMSAATMVFSPVALGKEAENLTRSQITSALHTLGLQKPTTVGEFWNKIKNDVPGYMYKDFEGLVQQNRNMLMPEVSVSSVKGVYGEEVPVVRLSQNGKTDTIQFFGEKEKFIKYNGVTLTERDVQRVRDAEAKIEASDYNLKRESDKYKEQFIRSSSVNQNAKDFARFQGFPRMTPQLWKSLTPQKRARFIVTMRTLWLDARRVQAAFKRKPASIKKSKSKKSASLFEGLELIFGQRAFANQQTVITTARDRAGSLRRPADAGGQPPPPPPPVAGDARAATAGAATGSQQYCIAAGYIVAQVGQGDNVNGRNRTLCDVRQALNNPRYQAADMNFIAQDNQTCKTQNNNNDNFVACNPVIYGYDRSSGGPICVDRMSQQMQDATTYPGACDTASRLTTSTDNIDITANESTRIGQIEDNQIADPNGAYKLSENYLDSVLKHRHNGQGLQALVKDGAWTADVDTELLNIQRQFEADIRDGINYCDQNHSNGSNIYTVDRNQQAACDQLHRRWLFTEKFISEYRVKACPEGTHYVGTYATGEKVSTATQKTSYNKMASNSQLCECDSGAVTPPPPPADSGSAPPPAVSSSAPPPPAVASTVTSSSPTRVALGSSSAACGGTSVTPPPPPASTPPPAPSGPSTPASGDHSGGFPLWAKIGLGLLAVGGILCLTHTLICKKKKKDDPPGVCVAPKSGTYPNCVCSNTCTAGTMNPNSCTCDVVPPAVCPLPVQTRNAQGVCTCDASLCASGTTQDPVTCQCSVIPLCPGTTTPIPAGGVANCPPPACPDGQPRQNGNCPTNCGNGVYVYSPNTCPTPSTNEGGSGNSCTNPPCSGGVPTGTGH